MHRAQFDEVGENVPTPTRRKPPAQPVRARVRPGGRSERIREAVMRACLEMLTEGKVELPVAEVAERSGVNRGTVYRWWPTPTELLDDALEFHARKRMHDPDTGSWAGDVRAFVTDFAALAVDPIERGIMATMISGRYPSLNEGMMESYRTDLPHWFGMVGRAVGRGEVSPDLHPTMLLHLMLSPSVSVSLFEDRAMTPEEIDGLVTLVLRASAPPGAGGPESTPRDAPAAVKASTKTRSAPAKRAAEKASPKTAKSHVKRASAKLSPKSAKNPAKRPAAKKT